MYFNTTLGAKINNKKPTSLAGLFFIGLIFIAVFFIGGNASLLTQNIANWPKAKAEVISVEPEIVCETPERSSACYTIFFIKYSYNVNGKEYINQMKQEYVTNYIPGKTFDVLYKQDNPQLVFKKDDLPGKFKLYLSLIIGLIIVIPIMFFWKQKRNRRVP
ncbi:MAG: DUF3592 domain-containing protein [Candidatus Omnitrophota bacterium]|nr:DUF3592 domain-containing protein [Candidatus Omnitrophota bacterium]